MTAPLLKVVIDVSGKMKDDSVRVIVPTEFPTFGAIPVACYVDISLGI